MNYEEFCWICRETFTQEERKNKVAFVDPKREDGWLEWVYAHSECFSDKEPLTEQELALAREERVEQLQKYYNIIKN